MNSKSGDATMLSFLLDKWKNCVNVYIFLNRSLFFYFVVEFCLDSKCNMCYENRPEPIDSKPDTMSVQF